MEENESEGQINSLPSTLKIVHSPNYIALKNSQ